MALGYELTKTRPDVEQLVGKCAYELVELFVFIFFHPDDRQVWKPTTAMIQL